MSWYRKTAFDNAAIALLSVIKQVEISPSVPFEDKLYQFNNYDPQQLENALAFVTSQVPYPNETQQMVIAEIQKMISGSEETKEAIPDINHQDNNMMEDQNQQQNMIQNS